MALVYLLDSRLYLRSLLDVHFHVHLHAHSTATMQHHPGSGALAQAALRCLSGLAAVEALGSPCLDALPTVLDAMSLHARALGVAYAGMRFLERVVARLRVCVRGSPFASSLRHRPDLFSRVSHTVSHPVAFLPLRPTTSGTRSCFPPCPASSAWCPSWTTSGPCGILSPRAVSPAPGATTTSRRLQWC
jgi:hypothetical protein